MKRGIWASLIAAAVMVIAGSATAENTIVYANYQGDKEPVNKALSEFFAAVTKETGGSLKFDFHSSATLLDAKTLPSGVRDGTADAGFLVGAFVPAEMPIDTYLGAFGMFADDPLVMSAVHNELVLLHCPQCQAEYRKFNSYFFAAYAITPYLLQCKREVRTLADIKGLKVRAIGPWADLVRSLNAVPFNVSANEIYEALGRGTIDCAGAALNWQRIRSLGEVAKYVAVEPGLGSFVGGCAFCLRTQKWKELTEQQRQAILKNAPAIVAKVTFSYIEDDLSAKKEFEQKGTKFYAAAPDLAKAINDFKSTFKTSVLEFGKQRKVSNPDEIAAAIFKLIDKWTALIAQRNDWTRESYAGLLYREIYSKVKYQ